MEAINLEGKVALVTGGARGQGRSHAVQLARAGADVVIGDIVSQIGSVPYPLATPEDLEVTKRLVEAEGRRCLAMECDVRDPNSVDALVEEAETHCGGLDIVVANAGIVLMAEAWGTTDEEWTDVLSVNLTGVFNTLRATTRAMVRRNAGGSVICTGSVCSQRPQSMLTAYTASKHGVVGLVRSFALELAPYSIRVNAVEPGNVLTPMIDNDALLSRFRPDLEAPTRNDVVDGFQDMNIMPTPWVEPNDISAAVLWLASDHARFVTGVELPVDAGLLTK